MDFVVENFIPPRNLGALRRMGLHKIAGAMLGVPEVTFKEAVAYLGAKAFLHRAEATKIAHGIEALATLRGEKVANVWQSVLQRSTAPALLGAGIAALPEMTGDQPINWDNVLRRGAMGAAVGGVGGAALNLDRAFQANPGLANALHHAVQGMV
jgi:hypothetical protein